MQPMTGLELLHEIPTYDRFEDMPLILITAEPVRPTPNTAPYRASLCSRGMWPAGGS